MPTPAGLDFLALCDSLAEELGEVTTGNEAGVTSFARGRPVFARASRDTLEVRLPADIAEAALRTRDTTLVGDDRGWIRFTLQDDERHVTDRAEAWFRAAWRHAGDN